MQCWNVSVTENVSSTASDRFNISNSCALFDFALFTVGVGTMVGLGVAGNSLSFVVLLVQRDVIRGTRPVAGTGASAFVTSFLLRALAAADTMVLLSAIPLYVLPHIYPHTGYLYDYYQLYLTILPILWPIFLIPFTGSVFITVLVSVDRYLAVCRPFGSGVGLGKLSGPLSASRVRCLVGTLAVVAFVYNVPRFFEYQRVEECVAGLNETRAGFEITQFGAHLLYRIVYANILYFIIIHGGPLLALGFLNVRLVQALRQRHQRRIDMTATADGATDAGGTRAQRDITATLVGDEDSGGTRAQRDITTTLVSDEDAGGTRTQRDITATLVGVVCVFIVCQTPTLVDHVLRNHHVLWSSLIYSEATKRCKI